MDMVWCVEIMARHNSSLWLAGLVIVIWAAQGQMLWQKPCHHALFELGKFIWMHIVVYMAAWTKVERPQNSMAWDKGDHNIHLDSQKALYECQFMCVE